MSGGKGRNLVALRVLDAPEVALGPPGVTTAAEGIPRRVPPPAPSHLQRPPLPTSWVSRCLRSQPPSRPDPERLGAEDGAFGPESTESDPWRGRGPGCASERALYACTHASADACRPLPWAETFCARPPGPGTQTEVKGRRSHATPPSALNAPRDVPCP